MSAINIVTRETEQITEDLKFLLFSDRSFDPELEFETWTGEGNSFIVSKGSKSYRIAVYEEFE